MFLDCPVLGSVFHRLGGCWMNKICTYSHDAYYYALQMIRSNISCMCDTLPLEARLHRELLLHENEVVAQLRLQHSCRCQSVEGPR